MAAVTICSDFGAQKKESLTLFPLFPHLFPMEWWDQMPWSLFSECWALSKLFHSPLSLSSRGFLVSLSFLPLEWYLYIWGYWYFSQHSWFQLVIHPALHFTWCTKRHYFANKGPSSQGYGFSSSHVWMWELDCKESWATKNWCFWTVVLEKTLESPLDCKEIQPVHSKGDQP